MSKDTVVDVRLLLLLDRFFLCRVYTWFERAQNDPT